MNEVKKCLGKGFGWICTLNRWSVQEDVHLGFCPMTLQVLVGKRTVQADSCLHSEQIDTLFISVGGQEGSGDGKSFWAGGPKFTHYCQEFCFEASMSSVPICCLICTAPCNALLCYSDSLSSVIA
jgi:hypothetical protein